MDNTVGERIRTLRKDLKLSQAEFGAYFGLSDSAIGMIENNKSVPTFSFIQKLASLGIREEYIISGRGLRFFLTDQEHYQLESNFLNGINAPVPESDTLDWIRLHFLDGDVNIPQRIFVNAPQYIPDQVSIITKLVVSCSSNEAVKLLLMQAITESDPAKREDYVKSILRLI